MPSLADWTEFDEQSNTLAEALEQVYLAALRFYAQEETYGVLMAYEQAALKKGASLDNTEAHMAHARKEMKK